MYSANDPALTSVGDEKDRDDGGHDEYDHTHALTQPRRQPIIRDTNVVRLSLSPNDVVGDGNMTTQLAAAASGQFPRPQLNTSTAPAAASMIVNVWAHNLRQEMMRIVTLVDEYNFIAMDTEFPGVVARPVGTFKTSNEYHYQSLKCNVDMLKMIQLGICLMDADANDMYAADSIELLEKSGIDFHSHAENGIDVSDFAEILIVSGIVLNENIRWISFHSGYDFAYLLKMCTAQSMPNSEADFFELLHIYFPIIYDVKYLMKSCEYLSGGLQKVAELLSLERIGQMHQAGSDSLLTAATFFRIKELFFENDISQEKFANNLFGLGQNISQTNGANNTNNNNTNNNNTNNNTQANSSATTTTTIAASTTSNNPTQSLALH